MKTLSPVAQESLQLFSGLLEKERRTTNDENPPKGTC